MSRLPALRCVLFVAAALAARAQPVPLTVNPASREEVRQFYRGIYFASDNVPMNWTGSYATGNAGDTSPAFKEATRLRINFFRALMGVPARITFNPTYNAKAQQAALMMSVNAPTQGLTHFPPPSWTFYTAEGREAAEKSNIGYGFAGPDAVTAYIRDEGAGNEYAGHRRWLAFPQTLQMGTGDVPGDGTPVRAPASTVWIIDSTPGGTSSSPRPATRTTQVTYPPAGYIPHTLVWPRWSFSHPGADFSGATVTMTRGGQPVPVRLEPLNPNQPLQPIGEPTIVWVYNNLDGNSDRPHPRPEADTTYAVSVNNVRIGGASQNFNYNVTVFDPEVPGADATPTTISGDNRPTVGTGNTYAVSKPAFVPGFDWRTVRLAAFTKTFDAERGLDGLIATTTPGYDLVHTSAVLAGNSVYRLAHPAARDQILRLPDTYYVGGGDAAISFRSQLSIATPIETARVQVSTDEGRTWVDVFSQAGTSEATSDFPAPTETLFFGRVIPLTSFVGRMINVRLLYSAGAGRAFVPAPNNTVGWFIDDFTLLNVQTVAPDAATRVAAGGTFSFTPTAPGALGLQARGVLFGEYPLEWGPVVSVTALTEGAINNPARLSNLSIVTSIPTSGDSFSMGYVVGGGGTSGEKPLVIRAAGPSLGALGVPGTLDDPKIELFAGPTKTGENDNWGGLDAIRTAMASVGAFAFVSPASRDAAVVANITTPNNSVKVSAAGNGTGTVIAEIYDATPTANFSSTTPRLINLSVLKHLGSGLSVGFVIAGEGDKKVLIRAIGPTLGAAFGLDGVVADPQLTLSNAAGEIARNDNWGGTAALTAAFNDVGAFALPAASRDAALLATLAPGNYSVQVSGVNNTTGTALVEVYEVP